jgi:tetratricopeptide (TPR) repeat protein
MIQQNEPYRKEKGYRSLALLNVYFGKYSEAQEHFREAVRFAAASKSKLAELINRRYLAGVLIMKGRKNAFDKEMMAVKQIQKEVKISPGFIYPIGRDYARLGRVREAKEQLDYLESSIGDLLASSGIGRSNRSDQADFYMLKGEVEVAEKRYEEAVDSFQTAASLGRDWVEETLGYAFWKSGDLNKAAGKYEEYLKSYQVLGNETLERWILAHYELAKVFEQKGQPEEATKYYERFLEIWKDGDPDLPVLIDAKKRLAKLKSVPLTAKTS